MAQTFKARMKARFATITTNSAKLNLYIHETAVEILEHAKEHDDCSYAQELVMTLPASFRRSMLILWFGTFSPIVVKDDAKWVAKAQKPAAKLFVPYDIEGGKAKPFYEMAEAIPEGKTYDFEALLEMVARLGKTISKKIEDGKVADADVNSANAIVSALAGLKVSKVRSDNGAPLVVQPNALPDLKGKVRTVTLKGPLAEVPSIVTVGDVPLEVQAA